MKEAVHDYLHAQPRIFHANAFKKIVDQWVKCFEKQENYVQEEYICNAQNINKKYLGKQCANL
jgi:hypothetical protein